MYCLIADLITEVPEAGGLAPRCQAYLYDGNEESDIVSETTDDTNRLIDEQLNEVKRLYDNGD